MPGDQSKQTSPVADLQAANKEYEAMFDAVSESIFLLNVDESGTIRFQRFNKREEEFTGKSTEDVRGETPIEVFGDDLGKELRAHYRRCIEQQEPITYEEELHRGGAATVWRTTLTPIIENGRVQQIVGKGKEVTKLQQSERERERQLSFLENTSDVIVVLGKDGIGQYQNHCREHLPGPDALDVTNKDPSQYIHPDDRRSARETFDSVLESPGAAASNELRIEQAGGEYGWYEQRVVNLIDDPAVGGVLVSSRDIADQKQRERALERLHASARDLMTATTAEEVATIGSETATEVLDHPLNGIHLYEEDVDALVPAAWTESTERLLEEQPPALPIEDSLGGKAYRTGNPKNYPDLSEVYDRLTGDTPFSSELILPLGDHGVFILSSTSADRFDEVDKTLAKVLTANIEAALDRVEQRKQLKRQNERLDEFASVLSHDLRNPLNVAMGRLELAQAEHESEHLDAVDRAHTRIQTLIEDLLTLGREGNEVGELEPVELDSFIRDCWRNVKTEDATIVSDIDQTVRADRSRLKQLLENLFRNAVEHAGTDSTVTVGAVDNGFFIEDNGPGIPLADQDEVFDVGYSTADDGNGFGLSIVKQIAQAHGWTVTVTQGTAGGARFEIVGVDTASG